MGGCVRITDRDWAGMIRTSLIEEIKADGTRGVSKEELALYQKAEDENAPIYLLPICEKKVEIPLDKLRKMKEQVLLAMKGENK